MQVDKSLIERILLGSASDEEMAACGAENVYAAKADNSVKHYRPFVSKRAPKTAKEDDRTVIHESSNGDRDRMGDVLDPRGWDVKDFLLNPILLWMHRDDMLPLGTVPKLRKAKDESDGHGYLETVSRFHPAEKNPFAEAVWRLVRDGDLPAVSVGFLPQETVRPSDDNEREKLNLGPWGVYYKRQSLLELSVVTIPALQTALAKRIKALAASGEIESSVVAEIERFATPDLVTRTVHAVTRCEFVDELTDTVTVLRAAGGGLIHTMHVDDNGTLIGIRTDRDTPALTDTATKADASPVEPGRAGRESGAPVAADSGTGAEDENRLGAYARTLTTAIQSLRAT